MAPKVVTATDEADLVKQLERAEQENAEVYGAILIIAYKIFILFVLQVSGDDDEDEEEVGMGGGKESGNESNDDAGSD